VTEALRIEVHVRGCLGGDLRAMVQDLDPRVVPRHTVITVSADVADHGPIRLLHALEHAGIEVERFTT
jgi:hypothetical protein